MALKFTHSKTHPFTGLVRGGKRRKAERRKAVNVVTYEGLKAQSLGASFDPLTGYFSKVSKTPSIL